MVRSPASPSRSRTTSPRQVSGPPVRPGSSRATSRRTMPTSWNSSGGKGPRSSARPTWTSSAWARPPRRARSAPPEIRSTRQGFRAALRAGAPLRSPQASSRWRSAPTRAARSGAPRRSAGSWGSNPPTAGSPATVSSPTQTPLSRSDRWHGRSRMYQGSCR